jgi:hypothetical protein
LRPHRRAGGGEENCPAVEVRQLAREEKRFDRKLQVLRVHTSLVRGQG